MTKRAGGIVVGMLLAAMALGQKNAPPPPPPPSPAPMQYTVPSGFDQAKKIFDSNGKEVQGQSAPKDEDCFLPPLNGVALGTTAVAELQVSAKTQKEYQQGCASLRDRKIADAENHLRKAVKQDTKYSAAWVLLGQVLEAQQKMDEAREACSQPVAGSPYVPAYLCLADISARAKNWDDVLKLTTRALELDSTMDAAAYSYNAAAHFNLHQLPEAEKSALKASEIDKSNRDPRVHFLLAQIYEAKGDRANEAAQLREYLKYVTDANDAAMVKSYLAALGQ